MSRTPLLRTLQRIARDHRAAEAAGVDACEIQGARAEHLTSDRGLTRRDVLRAGLLAGAGTFVGGQLLMPGAAHAASAPRVQPRIAVVGAGIAGMTAAMTLKDFGFSNITVYEANPTRIGGRVWSNRSGYWTDNQVSEWGGELIDSNHKTIFTLAQRFGIKTFDTNHVPGDDIYFFDGSYYSYAQASDDFKVVNTNITRDMQSFTWPISYNGANTAAGIALSRMSLYDWIETRVPGGHASRMGQLLDVAYNIEYGEETTRQSALNLLGLLGYKASPGNFAIYGLSDERWKLVGGNDQITTAQADYVGWGSIQMGWSLLAVRKNSDGTYTLTFNASGSTRTVTADQVILALPVSIMRDISLAGGFGAAAGFSPFMDEVVRAYPMGANAKVQLQFTDRLWTKPGPWGAGSNGESFSDQGYQLYWEVSRGQAGASGVLVNYTGGDVTRAQSALISKPFGTISDGGTYGRQVQAMAQKFLMQVEPVVPGLTQRWNGKATVSMWPQNPYSKGAYSYWSPGYPDKYSGYERVPQGNVHFAGEYCSIDFQGYIEGGAAEGVRAANEVYAASR